MPVGVEGSGNTSHHHAGVYPSFFYLLPPYPPLFLSRIKRSCCLHIYPSSTRKGRSCISRTLLLPNLVLARSRSLRVSRRLEISVSVELDRLLLPNLEWWWSICSLT